MLCFLCLFTQSFLYLLLIYTHLTQAAYIVWSSQMEEKHVLVCGISFKWQRHNVSQARLLRHCVLANTATL